MHNKKYNACRSYVIQRKGISKFDDIEIKENLLNKMRYASYSNRWQQGCRHLTFVEL